MIPGMCALGTEDLQIIRRVVSLIPVYVVNNFSRQQLSAKFLLGRNSVRGFSKYL